MPAQQPSSGARGGGASAPPSSSLQEVKQMRDRLMSLEAKMKTTRRDIEAGYHITPQNSGPTSAPRRTGSYGANYKTSSSSGGGGGSVYGGLSHDPRTPPALTVPTGAAVAGLSRTGSGVSALKAAGGSRPASRLADSAKAKR